jgi:hypothetical protein
VFILKAVKVLCFDTLLQVFILKVLTLHQNCAKWASGARFFMSVDSKGFAQLPCPHVVGDERQTESTGLTTVSANIQSTGKAAVCQEKRTGVLGQFPSCPSTDHNTGLDGAEISRKNFATLGD